MSLEQALDTLARVHTKDDETAGFVVVMGAAPEAGNMVINHDYITAWGVVRERLGRPSFLEHEGQAQGVFVQIVAGRPVVSIRCGDNVALEELTALARRIMAAIG
ncbi:hypothetical protein GFL93_12890 [Rhizobium leguminosarum bv. viciae]|uniref:hypothetical protein n=1 Tax=Rhizobium TaxID=379 RepID=UPI0014425A6E|nr:hypothetical protein [Rhizobium leguminosarum]NKK06757.1 hypothetical protein [Rhizobium leguminosarum bv. viciae]